MNITLPDRVKLPFEFDAKQLRLNLSCIEELIKQASSLPQNGKQHWRTIDLYHQQTAVQRAPMQSMAVNSSRPSNSYLDSAPYIQAVLNHFKCPIVNVLLAKITAHSSHSQMASVPIDSEHGLARLYIPITANDEVCFVLNSVDVAMQAGECWYLRVSDPYSVMNSSAEDKVHLIIDTRVNLWLATQLKMQ
ncbi:aspartyl/asparaginyl beta-hydroxylase domain-containing protein [Shewanella waksmanii]|uniref:aspartyl/asparaginyl beta-hydroxylase domain-containing protein n=1 Tax=Shewanella waksmanii TaxID=213783 RepID=UPI003735920B